MDRLVGNLIQLLLQCEELYTRMLPVIEQEKQAALEIHPEHLHQLNTDKENLVTRLKALDQQRDRLLEQMAQLLPPSRECLTLSTLIHHVSPDHGAQLASLKISLAELFARIRRANDESRLLVAHCLTLVNNTLNFFSHWTRPMAVYGASGNIYGNAQGQGRFLSNTV